MQVFVCYPEPIRVAECLDRLRLTKQVIEARQILNSIDGLSKSWKNHPVCLMYREHREWLYNYMCCMDCYLKGLYDYAKYWSDKADEIIPSFITDEMVTQHKRRLYTKNPDHYKQFAEYGKSDENWYCIDGEIVKYINGKRL